MHSLIIWTDPEKMAFQNKVIDYMNMVYMDGLLPIPENGKVTIQVAPGVTAYFSKTSNVTVSSSYLSVDYDFAGNACAHLLGTGDFSGLDASVNLEGQVAVTSTQEFDDGSSIYSSSGVNIYHDTIFLEHGATVPYVSVTDEETSVNSSVTMACGVEISAPVGWQAQEEYATNPDYDIATDNEDFETAVIIAGAIIVGAVVGFIVAGPPGAVAGSIGL